MSESTKDTSKNDVAVYIDYENLYISLRSTVRKNPDFDVILEKCREWGRITIARAYSDWSEFARVVTGQMFSSGIEPIYVPTRKFYDAKTRSQATKNAVDIHIAIDIVKDVLLTKNIDTFVLVSGDRDFVPLINVIRAAGKEIYAIGVAGCTSSELAVAVDGMYYYHQLLQTDEDLEKEQHDIYAKLARAVEIARARGYRSTLGVVKPIMREVIAGFDERKILSPKGVAYAKFQDFVKDAEKNGFVKTTITPGGGALEIWLAGENPDEVRRKDDERESGRGRGSGNGDRNSDRNGGGGRGRGRGRSGGGESRSRTRSAAADEAPSSEEQAPEEVVEVVEAGTEGTDEEAKPRRRTRRGSRGGRGRRRAEGDESSDEMENEAADESASAETPEDGKEEAAPSEEPVEEVVAEEEAAPRKRTRKPAAPRRRAPATRKPAAAAAEVEAEPAAAAETEAAEDPASEADMLDLPSEAADDLRLILEEFGTRAPSQRRLVARLKKAASDGELKGEYREGHFLMAVRKGLEEGWLEKVSKGFYSGLKWSGEGASEGATAGA